MKPGSRSTQKLAAEAAAMEARLTALKLELQKDKAKRAAAGVPADGSKQASIWCNGKQGPLRKTGGTLSTTGTDKQPVHAAVNNSKSLASSTDAKRSSITPSRSSTGRTVVPHTAAAQSSRAVSRGAASSSGISSGRSSTARPSSCSSTSSTGSLDTASSDTPSKAANRKPHWLRQLKQQQQQQQAHCITEQQQAPQPSLHNPTTENTGPETAGSLANDNCLTNEPSQHTSLLNGTYDEAAAASSFQEALRQWRQAKPCSATATSSVATTSYDDSSSSSSPAPGSCKQASGTASSKAYMGPAQSPASDGVTGDPHAAPQHNIQHGSTSTSAATSVGGGNKPVNSSVAAFLEKLAMRSSTALPDPTATPTTSPGAALDSSMAAASRSSGNSSMTQHVFNSCQGVDDPRGPAVHVEHQLEAGAGVDADLAATDGNCSSGAASPRNHQAFDSWLAQAEKAAAAAAVAAHRGPGQVTPCDSSLLISGHTCSPCSDSALVSLQPPDTSAAAGQYHRQLESVLQAVEDLEAQLESRMQSRPWQPQADA